MLILVTIILTGTICGSKVDATPVTIIHEKEASQLEKLAAREIRRYVYLRTGELLPIIEREVKRRLDLFGKGGFFLGPTHAIQVGSPLENILALCRSAGSLCEKIDDSILSIKDDEDQVDKINMSKLY